ncbi:MAG: ECF RNA polymerase sigma factor SigL [Phycisphaerae bacterium]|nr:ECF RNA polymerase sigma factor SigL [Phycisphaerae bacterium]
MNDDESIGERRRWVAEAVDRYGDELTRYACRLTGDPESARDVVQETFVRLCRQRVEQVNGHLGAWLYTVCRNRALDVQRKEKRMGRASETVLATQADAAPPPPAAAESNESAARALTMLDDLPANQAEAIRLKFQAGFSYRQIAHVLGTSAGNVGFLIHAGLKTLRARLKVN